MQMRRTTHVMHRLLLWALTLTIGLVGRAAQAQPTVPDSFFNDLFLQADAAPPGMKLDGRKDVENAEDKSTYGMLRGGRNDWKGPPDNAIFIFNDIRLVFPTEEAAKRYLDEKSGRLSEGLPRITSAPEIGTDGKVFGGVAGDPGGTQINAYMYVFRVRYVVVKVFGAHVVNAPRGLSALVLAPFAQRAKERLEEKTKGPPPIVRPAAPPKEDPKPVAPSPAKEEPTPPRKPVEEPSDEPKPDAPAPTPAPSAEDEPAGSAEPPKDDDDDDDDSSDDEPGIPGRHNLHGMRVEVGLQHYAPENELIPSAWGGLFRVDGAGILAEEFIGLAIAGTFELGVNDDVNIPFDLHLGPGLGLILGPVSIAPIVGLGIDTLGAGDDGTYKMAAAFYWYVEARLRIDIYSFGVDVVGARTQRGAIDGTAAVDVPHQLRLSGHLGKVFEDRDELSIGFEVKSDDASMIYTGLIGYGIGP